MSSMRILMIAAVALALAGTPACTREEPEEEPQEEMVDQLAESGRAGSGVGHGGGRDEGYGGMMSEPGSLPGTRPGGMGAYGEGEHMTLDQMREHMSQVHGRVQHMMTAPHMTGEWTAMGRHMAELDQDLERMIEQMRRLESDPAAAPRIEPMRRHMAEMLRSYESMVEAMETPPRSTTTPVPSG